MKAIFTFLLLTVLCSFDRMDTKNADFPSNIFNQRKEIGNQPIAEFDFINQSDHDLLISHIDIAIQFTYPEVRNGRTDDLGFSSIAIDRKGSGRLYLIGNKIKEPCAASDDQRDVFVLNSNTSFVLSKGESIKFVGGSKKDRKYDICYNISGEYIHSR